jgi:hypothetical protein
MLTSAGGGGPLYVDGEAIERVRVSTTRGPSRVVYVTSTGREIVAGSAPR